MANSPPLKLVALFPKWRVKNLQNPGSVLANKLVIGRHGRDTADRKNSSFKKCGLHLICLFICMVYRTWMCVYFLVNGLHFCFIYFIAKWGQGCRGIRIFLPVHTIQIHVCAFN